MQDHNSGDLNAKELVPIIDKWTDNYHKLLADMNAALRKLDTTRETLDAARKIYEKSWRYVIKENFKTSCCCITIIFASLVFGFVEFSQSSDVKLDAKNWILEKNTDK